MTVTPCPPLQVAGEMGSALGSLAAGVKLPGPGVGFRKLALLWPRPVGGPGHGL